MGWRDRVKKSFGDFEDIEHRGKNVKSDRNNNKKGSQVILNGYPHNPQNPQNPEKETEKKVGSKKEPERTPAQNIPDPDHNTPKNLFGYYNQINNPAAAIPAPSPPGMGPEYENLWHRAWELADFIDDPAAAPLAERKAKLPELDRMRERMAEIEKQELTNVSSEQTPTTTSDSEEIKQIKPPGTWMPWKSSETTTRDPTPENCPAKCKRSGKCYARAYFEGKSGRAAECDPAQCEHIINERAEK